MIETQQWMSDSAEAPCLRVSTAVTFYIDCLHIKCHLIHPAPTEHRGLTPISLKMVYMVCTSMFLQLRGRSGDP